MNLVRAKYSPGADPGGGGSQGSEDPPIAYHTNISLLVQNRRLASIHCSVSQIDTHVFIGVGIKIRA